MAGGRVRTVRIVNRTTGPLDCMFDGVPDVVPAGYKVVTDRVVKLDTKTGKPVMRKTDTGEEQVEVEGLRTVGAAENGDPLAYLVEYAAAEAYVRQHPIMGTSDPTSTDAKDTDYLLGVMEWGDEISPIEQSDAVELIDRSMLGEDRQDIRVVRLAGGRRELASPSVIHDRKVKSNKRKHAMGAGIMGADNPNPFGIRVG